MTIRRAASPPVLWKYRGISGSACSSQPRQSFSRESTRKRFANASDAAGRPSWMVARRLSNVSRPAPSWARRRPHAWGRDCSPTRHRSDAPASSRLLSRALIFQMPRWSRKSIKSSFSSLWGQRTMTLVPSIVLFVSEFGCFGVLPRSMTCGPT